MCVILSPGEEAELALDAGFTAMHRGFELRAALEMAEALTPSVDLPLDTGSMLIGQFGQRALCALTACAQCGVHSICTIPVQCAVHCLCSVHSYSSALPLLLLLVCPSCLALLFSAVCALTVHAVLTVCVKEETSKTQLL